MFIIYLYEIYLTTSVTTAIYRQMIVNNELEKKWKEFVVAWFKVLSWYFLEGLRKSSKDMLGYSVSGRGSNWAHPEYVRNVTTWASFLLCSLPLYMFSACILLKCVYIGGEGFADQY